MQLRLFVLRLIKRLKMPLLLLELLLLQFWRLSSLYKRMLKELQWLCMLDYMLLLQELHRLNSLDEALLKHFKNVKF